MCRSLGCWSRTVGLLAVLFGLAQPMLAANLIIPPPPGVFGQFLDSTGTLRDAILIDGVPIAFRYDDFWSYSAQMLDQLQDAGFIPASYGDYQASTGTGNLDVILLTGAGGADNQNVGPSGTNDFEDPTDAPTGGGPGSTSADVWWGQNDQNNDGTADGVNGPVTVGQVLNYLQEFDPNNTTPVVIFDNNQTGTDPSTLGSARVQIIDPNTDTVIAEWFLDAINDNNQFDENAQALAFGEFTFHGTSGNDYTVNHNLGSGRPDFLIVPIGMDLSAYDPSFHFVIDMHLDGLNNGFEEAYLTGRVLADTTSVVPEPASLALLGLGSLVALIPVAIRPRKSRRSE